MTRRPGFKPSADVELKLLNTGKALAAKPKPSVAAVKPPPWLSLPQRKAWAELVASMTAMGNAPQRGDEGCLTAYLIAVEQMGVAAQQISTEGVTTTGATGATVRHPALIAFNALARQVDQLSMSLGLSVDARDRMKHPRETPTEHDDMQQMYGV